MQNRVAAALRAARECLLAERNPGGWWEGELSSSALSTAVAVLALGAAGDRAGSFQKLRRDGLEWLTRTQREDGGWGDTVLSRSNVATTLLVWSAFGQRVAGTTMEEPAGAEFGDVVERAEGWIRREAGGLDPTALGAALRRRYGKDKTFAVPILMACAVGGRLGPEPDCWKHVPALPFELAALPRHWFAALRLPVVSYALPALIAIGQVRHHHAPCIRPWRWVRESARKRTRRLLREIQPEGGGFLEATPLTGFVVMALASADGRGDPVVREGVEFLKRSVRPDGSWPIDTNLATWATTLSVKALGGELTESDRPAVLGWLLGQQYREKHPYCLSAPGGWAWTDLPGGVPDADDTAGGLLALKELSGEAGGPQQATAAEAGVRWLAGLQNRDGGVPTFCRGWGALPFDRSAPDLTAHALAAWQAWRGRTGFEALPAMRRAVAWLRKTQSPEGAWVPLWFGNEHEPGENNPVYGTATVLKYLCVLDAQEFPGLAEARRRAAQYLAGPARRENGSWGGGPAKGPPSLEETAAALEALLAFAETGDAEVPAEVIEQGGTALLLLTREGTDFPAAPIGLYFARLWYSEKLYPVIAVTGALRAWERRRRRPERFA